MKSKIAIVPKAQVKAKTTPDDTVYLTPDGTRVKITKSKQFPSHPDDPQWRKDLNAIANERGAVVRISDGHELWGCKIEDLKPA